MKTEVNGLDHLSNATNDGADTIAFEEPYTVEVTIEGAAALIFHRWSCDSVEAKSKAKKGSDAKKTDDIESYVYRNTQGEICLPGEYIRQSIIWAAKYIQDPRSPRKSAMDLFKAGVVAIDELCSLGSKDWDYLDRRRVVIQRNGVTRIRPAFHPGWKAQCRLMVLLPEYIDRTMLNDRLNAAGRLVGVGDYRPTYGRFQIVKFEVVQ